MISFSSAVTLYETYNDTSAVGLDIWGVNWEGQTFTIGTVGSNTDISLINISVNGFRNGNPTNVTYFIRAVNSSSHPIGANLSQGSFDPSGLTTAVTGQQINISMSPMILEKSTQYALISSNPTGDGSNSFRWNTNSSGSYAGGSRIASGTSGVGWNLGGGHDAMFWIWGNDANNVTSRLSMPPNATIITGNSTFIGNQTSSNGFNLTNTTILIWDSDDDVFFSQTNITLGVENSTSFRVMNLSVGDYKWNIFTCVGNATGSQCVFADANFTFTFSPFEVSGEDFNNPVLETSSQTFEINLSVSDGFTIQSGDLIYNGTTFSIGEKTNLGGNLISLSKTITIPSGIEGFNNETRSFFWNFTIVEESTGSTFFSTSNINSHNVSELTFGLCSTSLTIPVLNFTMFNETDGIEIDGNANATTFQATFNIGANPADLLKNISVNNISVNVNEFDFCSGNESDIFFADMVLSYTAVGFSDKNYVLSNASLSNSTNEISLFLLPEDDSIQFFITVEQELFPLTGAIVNVQKFFVGEGVFKTVEIDTTDGSGEFTSFLELDKDYRFTVIKNGQVLAIISKRSICGAAPCELKLDIGSDPTNIWSGLGVFFDNNIFYNLTFNQATKIVTFEFIDTTGLATSFRMLITELHFNQTGTIISDQRLFTSSGTMTFNMTGFEGEFRVDTFIARSPDEFLDFFYFVINEVAKQLGLLGLFSSFLLLLVIIFGIGFKPSFLIMAVPISIFITKLMGMTSISNPAIVMIFVIALVAIAFLSR